MATMFQKRRYYVPPDGDLQHHLRSILAKKQSNLTLAKLVDSTTSLYEIQGQEESVKDTLGMQ